MSYRVTSTSGTDIYKELQLNLSSHKPPYCRQLTDLKVTKCHTISTLGLLCAEISESTIRTLFPFPLVSVLKRFSCMSDDIAISENSTFLTPSCTEGISC